MHWEWLFCPRLCPSVNIFQHDCESVSFNWSPFFIRGGFCTILLVMFPNPLFIAFASQCGIGIFAVYMSGIPFHLRKWSLTVKALHFAIVSGFLAQRLTLELVILHILRLMPSFLVSFTQLHLVAGRNFFNFREFGVDDFFFTDCRGWSLDAICFLSLAGAQLKLRITSLWLWEIY